MLDLSLITAKLTPLSELAQVITPGVADTEAVDVDALLRDTVGAVVSDRVVPLRAEPGSAYPLAVYQQVSSDRVKVDGYPIIRTDTYVISLQADTTFAALVTAVDSTRTALLDYSAADAAGAMEITDQATEYYDDTGVYESLMQVSVTHLARTSQSLPAAFVYPLVEGYDENRSMTGIHQRRTDQFAVLLAAKIPAGGVSGIASIRDAVRGALAGVKPATGYERIQSVKGEVIEVNQSIVMWRDVFATARTVTN